MIQIEQIHRSSREGALVDIVDVDADARIRGEDELVGFDAPHAYLGCRSVKTALRCNQGIRNHSAQILDIGQALLGKLVTRHGRDRKARVLQVLAAELRGDDDLFELALLGACVGGRRCIRRPCRV